MLKIVPFLVEHRQMGSKTGPKLKEYNPDLVLIAYGMNDVGRRDPDWFEARLKELIGMIQSDLPKAEIILVSPMLGNAELIHTPREMFFQYRDRMKKLSGDGVAMSDVTEVWNRMLQRKLDLDLTGNGSTTPRFWSSAVCTSHPAAISSRRLTNYRAIEMDFSRLLRA